MKKLLVIIFTSLVMFSTCVSANYQYSDTQIGYAILFNGEVTGDTSVVLNDVHHVPLRRIFEKMGAHVFYRNSDRQILALSRDGDEIRHIVGDTAITVNGERKVFQTSSLLANNETYIPIDMISAALCPDGISYDNLQLNIQKYLFSSDYHMQIKDVLDVSGYSNFYPEKFKRYINYHVNMPAYNMQEVLFRVNLGLDIPFYENVTTIQNPYELLVLVNKYNQLPAGFTQYNLVHMDKQLTSNDGKEYLLAGVAYEKYVQMYNAAKGAGLSMKVVSAYRTEDYQRSLYNNKVKASGKAYADSYSARAGHSEHQTGLAVDINSTKGTFENTPEFAWLQQHAHEYGFIMRYPKGKEWITGYAYEPWHYRYVGNDVAWIIHQEGITYEEYYVKYILENEFK
ncbi:MAG: hypothetical protein E7417_01000 [Ruminococcaceae bacterium]|nr:hypothetical protein [Oscillospiraceae bacterium]